MTVQQFILDQPSPQQEIMTILRSWIFGLGRQIEQRISNKVPQFYFFGPICYFHAGPDHVELCFTKGYELSDEQKILQSAGRKHVKSISFYGVAELEEHEEEIRHLLNEAAILNEFQYKRKNKGK